ncbi:MAG: hypothetical protein WDN26_06825 [Chitinophagaceae bacterium]
MPDIFYLISKWWKQMLAVIILSLITVGIIVFLQPDKYLSVATALPASSTSADKARIFGNNPQELYTSFGNPDDLDRVLGTAQLDTIYLATCDEFNLWDHYKMGEKGQAARSKAAKLLRKNSRVIKSEYGELKTKVWDTDKNLAPQLANTLMEKLNSIHQDIQNESNRITLKSLEQGKEKLQKQVDSAGGKLSLSRLAALSDQLQQYEKLIGEYQLIVDTRPSALIIVEKARPSEWHDKPNRLLILTATALLSFIFTLLLALVMERRKKA